MDRVVPYRYGADSIQKPLLNSYKKDNISPCFLSGVEGSEQRKTKTLSILEK